MSSFLFVYRFTFAGSMEICTTLKHGSEYVRKYHSKKSTCTLIIVFKQVHI